MTQSAARLISTAGHPAVLMPAAAIIASAGSSSADSVVAITLAIACGLLLLAYSYYKTRSGAWAHIDASEIGERAQLNTRVGIALFVIAVGLHLADRHVAITAAVATSALIVLMAHFMRRTTKLSLHVAFATFAALMVWPHYLATIVFLFLTVGVGWSRLALRRHAGSDLLWGASVGAVAGLAFQAVRISANA